MESDNLEGKIAQRGYAEGNVVVVTNTKQNVNEQNYILITNMLTPEITPYIVKAKGVITENGGILSHVAIVAREMKIPCITSVSNILEKISDGTYITLDAREGKIGRVYLRRE